MNRLCRVLVYYFPSQFYTLETYYPKKSAIFYTLRYLMKLSVLIIFIAALVTIGGCAPNLISSARNGNITEVRNLLDRGADVNIKNKQGYYYEYTALMAAAGNGQTEIVKLLIDKGADVNAIWPGWSNGVTALMAAAGKGHTKIVKFLIDAGADVNVKNPDGFNALSFASYNNHIEAVKLLLDRGGDVNGETIRGPLWLSTLTLTGEKKVIKQLLSNGINIPFGKSYLVVPDYWI